MGLKKYEIVFDNHLATLVSGQIVSGRLLLTLETPKKIRAITIRLKGEGSVHWTKTHTVRSNGRTTTRTVHYSASEVYFEHKFTVVGGAGSDMTLNEGEYCYPFSMQLPANLPSSFEHVYGHCRYTVKANMDRPWKFDHNCKAAFTVISPLDLNFDQTARYPVKQTKEKHFCCCMCKSGPLTLVASIPVSGYVPGQEIPVTVEVDNISQQKIKNVVVSLRKIASFHARSPSEETKSVTIEISENSLGPVEKNGSETWTHMFKIPALPPSNLVHCRIIDLRYELKIIAKPADCCHASLDIILPLVIGTIPLSGYQQPVPMPGYQPSIYPPTAPPQETPQGVFGNEPPPYPTTPDKNPTGVQHSLYNSLYPDLPPPSYEEATYGAHNIQEDDENDHVQGNMNFTPRYPVYNFLPSAPSL